MDLNSDKKRTNVEDDRLSSLPDDVIHNILSFIGLRNAILTSSLSSRWRYIWTSLPFLDFSSKDFPIYHKFSPFVTNVLSRRNNLAQIFSIKLIFDGDFSQDFVKQMINYAFSHNIQQLDITFVLEKDIEFSPSLFSCQSLKHLSLIKADDPSLLALSVTATSIFQLPALTTLYLYDISLRDDNNDVCLGLFSKCVNLEKLNLENCRTKDLNSLTICHPRLSSLTIENNHRGWEVFNLVAPQLKYLTIRDLCGVCYYQISSPELTTLLYSGFQTLVISTDGDFHSLKTVDLCVFDLINEDAPVMFHLLQRFKSVQFLTLNLEILEILSSYMESISLKPSPFANLKSLKICPKKKLPNDKAKSMKVKNYLLNNSPNATFTMVSRQETQNIENTKLAQAQMTELQVVLEQEKAIFESNMARIEQEKLQVENRQQIRERVAYIYNFDTFLTEEIIKWKIKTREIISKLGDIKVLLSKLPASINAEMQPIFLSLSTEADTIRGNIRFYKKSQSDMKDSLKSLTIAYYNETSQSSSK